MAPFGGFILFFVLIIGFVHFDDCSVLTADDDILSAVSGHQAVANALESSAPGDDTDILFQNDFLIAGQDDRINDPVAAGLVDDQLFDAGVQRRLQVLSRICLVEAPPACSGFRALPGFDFSQLFGVIGSGCADAAGNECGK